MVKVDRDSDCLPLLFVDVDEVILEHLPHLVRALSVRGFQVLEPIHEMNGDVVEISTGRRLNRDEIKELTDACFMDLIDEQREIPDASSALESLSRDFEIYLLTNFPERYGDSRYRRLKELQIDLPILFNSGGKGRILRTFADRVSIPPIFVDDSISQITNAKKHCAAVSCIHFAYMDHVFQKYESYHPAEFQVRSWAELHDCIRSNFITKHAS